MECEKAKMVGMTLRNFWRREKDGDFDNHR